MRSHLRFRCGSTWSPGAQQKSWMSECLHVLAFFALCTTLSSSVSQYAVFQCQPLVAIYALTNATIA